MVTRSIERMGCAIALAGALALAGCAGPKRGPAVPNEMIDEAVVPGMSHAARTWGYAVNEEMLAEMVESVQRERAYLEQAGQPGSLPDANFLAISGGGANGAYTAGMLCGWTKAGTRPQFKVVTGISTGALIAPFAFLGPEYDDTLREVYTKTSTKDVMTKRNMLAAMFDDALADNKPLWKMTERQVDEKLLAAIAAEYRKGRILLIGTTNLDCRRGVIWNIGYIANSGHPKALDLVRSIMIASAAIPAAFPPVMIDVEAGGKQYQEMHVDGGTVAQVFLYPPSLKIKELAHAHHADRARRAYVIRNSRVDPDWSEVERQTLSIAGKAIGSLLRTQGIGDLYRIYLDSQRDGVEYNLAYIPASFKEPQNEAFDPIYMTKLFELGYQQALGGYPWMHTPPGFAVATSDAATPADSSTVPAQAAP